MKAIEVAGGHPGALGGKIGISRQAVDNWERVPAERVHDVEEVTGLARSFLRPDIYPPERERKRAKPKR